MRAEFLGMVSHELRAPLTSILGSTGMLLEQAAQLDPAERREFYRIIDGRARSRSRPSPQRWPRWWRERGPRSCPATGGTAC